MFQLLHYSLDIFKQGMLQFPLYVSPISKLGTSDLKELLAAIVAN